MKIDPDDIAALADDYVLGLLDEHERLAVEREIDANADLRAAVGASRDRFIPLDDILAPAPVDHQLWPRIAAALPVQETPGETGKPAANDNRRDWWPATAMMAIASTILLAIGLGYSLLRATEPVVIAVLLNDKGGIHAVIEDFGDRNATVRLLEHIDIPAGKTIQAWTLPSPEMGPVSIGLIEDEQSGSLDMPPLPRPHADQLYELTIEDEGGSPTGRPTGTIIAKGFAKLPI